ncbi:MAG: helicase [Treponema sp.]|nr:MAG: helicase [Treponema sp.]
MARNKYGTTPWGKWFLKMLSNYDGSGRLTRGRTYANTGRVENIKISGRVISSRVKGSYDPWYDINLEFPKISQTTENKIVKIFVKNKMELVALRNGIMQDSLIEIFEKKNIRLIPAKWSKLVKSCSCPDYGDPCKHMAAVLFILSREIDYDPRLIFQLGGFDLNKDYPEYSNAISKNNYDSETFETKTTNNLQSNAEKKPAPVFEIEQPVPITMRNKKTVEELLDSSETKSESKIKNKVLSFPSAESYIPLVTSFLPQQPVFSVSDFVPKLKEFYHTSLALYDFNFYANAIDLHGAENIFYSNISINTKTLSKSKSGFPLSKKSFLTLNIKQSAKSFFEFTLLQAGVLFSIKPNVASDLSSGYCTAYSFFQLAKKIIHDSAFIPAVNISNKVLSVFWKPLTASTEINSAIDEFANMLTDDFFSAVSKWGKRYCAELLLTAYLTEYVLSMNFTPKLTSAYDRQIDSLFFGDNAIDTSIPGNKNLATVIYTWLAVLNYTPNEYLYRLTLKIISEDRIDLFASVLKLDEVNSNFQDLHIAIKKSATPERILKFPIVLASYLPEITDLVSKKSVRFNLEEVGKFLSDSSQLLKRFGVEIILPKALQKTLKPKTVLSVKTTNSNASVQTFLSLTDILEYDKKIMLGSFEISIKEFQKLVKENSRIIKFNDQYVLLDPKEVAKLFDNLTTDEITPLDLMQSILTKEAVISADAQIQIDSIFKSNVLNTPKNLNAKLRSYQEKGFSWMYANIKSGFGCLLADDMGLGKTIQVISLILILKEKNELDNGVIIVSPASLISNWLHEINKFAPNLICNVYHGKKRKLNPKAEITLTTYQTMQKDIDKVIAHNFFGIIIDEAQSIKNSNTKTAKALKKTNTRFRIALTGTPVENNLEDLRSIFDFILPNYLGDAKTFKHKWRIPIELHSNREISERLQKITAPFILRRLKTDKKIISDLPEKITTNNYCNLTVEQVALYESLIDTQLNTIKTSDTEIKRHARILKLLTGLKQICNHPRVFDKTSPESPHLSGKVLSLLFLLKEILANGEKVIIFSQYVETLKLLKTIIQKELNTSPLSITGAINPKKRQEAVELFQTNPGSRVLLISLKAGGTGLNLTAAGRVIHFDLWYNPAVEDQATDRAFRIGQKSNVFVHRLICEGTFEEKIDKMIQKKRNIADAISGGETWISKLTNSELEEILTLQK